MTEKLKEFQQAVNTNVDQVIASRLSSFFDADTTSEIENELFNEDFPPHLLDACSAYFQSQARQSQDPAGKSYHLKQSEFVQQLAGQKTFSRPLPAYTSYSGVTDYFYFFKQCGILIRNPGHNKYFTVYPHNIPLDVLLGVKIATTTNGSTSPFETLMSYSTKHPEAFRLNCAEFERVCQDERKAISLQREGLEELTRQTTERMAEAERMIKDNEDSEKRRQEAISLQEEAFERLKKKYEEDTLLQQEALEELTRQTLDKMAEAERMIKENEDFKQRHGEAISLQEEALEELTRQTTERLAEAERIIKKNKKRQQQLVIDEEKMKEEKQKMTVIKERLVGMRSELDRERQEFEEEKKRFLEQKNKTIDLDAYFDDILCDTDTHREKKRAHLSLP